ncbi:flagellar basal-body MS-ring/collar protein FliF [Alphaproteobacteria bacterium]|nr:flagellar basal-body MS-ring/collar protein FliF [Alphaproteobacteria bacterium]MDB3916140.1 flagellar basal-body MS-ring/collar protein FliF [Alphaproteobacteria bacterium]
MAEATTGNNLSGLSQNTGIVSRISSSISNVRKITSDPAVQKSIPLIFGVIVAFIGLIVFFTMQKSDMTTLFASLPESEKAAVIQTLKQNGVDVSLNPTTGEVIVPVAEYHESRMLLAGEGLPSSVPNGYDTLGDMPMGTSRSVEAVKIKQSLEAELSRSINHISGVSSARVHLAIPEKTVFAREIALPSASIFVKLSNGRSLGRQQVQSIVHLVASSVPNLPSENITVVDQFGELLSKPSGDGSATASNEQMSQTMRLGEIYRSRIISLLTPIVGAGNLKAEVNVDMNFTKSEITEESVDPKGNALRSEQTSLDESANPEARGIPGALSNAPPLAPDLKKQAPENKGVGANLKQRSQTSVKNYEVSRKVETTTAQYGQITKIKAAVIIREMKSVSPEGTVTFEKFSDEKLVEIKSLVQEALGFDETRGDSVTVTSSPFVDALEAEIVPWYENESIKELAQQLATVLILAIVIFGALHPLLKRVLVPAGYTSGVGSVALDEEDDVDEKIEVQEGESLEDIKAKLKPKKSSISAEMLDTANTYDDKVAVIRMIVGDEAGRVSSVFKGMIEKDS